MTYFRTDPATLISNSKVSMSPLEIDKDFL